MTLRNSILLVAGILTAGIFALDYAAGREFDLWLLYVLPVGLASVVIGPRYGFGFAAIATGLLFLGGYLLGNPFTSIAAFLLDRASNGCALFLLAYLIGLARTGIASNNDASANTQSWNS